MFVSLRIRLFNDFNLSLGSSQPSLYLLGNMTIIRVKLYRLSPIGGGRIMKNDTKTLKRKPCVEGQSNP